VPVVILSLRDLGGGHPTTVVEVDPQVLGVELQAIPTDVEPHLVTVRLVRPPEDVPDLAAWLPSKRFTIDDVRGDGASAFLVVCR
jgi:hypothetical protein